MKREFLANIKVGETPLSKEAIDAIMAENGRDIEAEKAKYTDYETIKTQLSEAQTTIQGMKDKGQTVEAMQARATEWESKYNQAIAAHKEELANMAFDKAVDDAISAAHGKNAKAVKALLDLDTLKASKNRDVDIKSALEACQKENDYLFGGEQTPPPFAGGTGTNGGNTDPLAAIKAAAGI